MRALAHDLGVTTMALYRHVAGKDELIDIMIDRIFSQIDLPVEASDWKIAVKSHILSAREALLRHAWAFRALESRRRPVPTLLAYLDSLVGLFRSAGFSPELTCLALHVLGARALGLDDNLFDSALLFPESPALQLGGMEQLYPHLAELRDAALLPAPLSDPLNETLHSDFELTLDRLLDTIERLTV